MKKDLLALSELTRHEIESLLNEAEAFANGESWHVAKQTFVANLFFEPSTRTSCSFEIAEKKVGVDTLNISVAHSSVQKGESLYDTARTLASLGVAALVIRHPKDRFYEQLKGIEIPILNAGDGCGNHPTQSLLDLLTIKQQFGSFRRLRVVIVGDLLHSRVARSNADVLKRLGADVYVSGPQSWMGTFVHDFPYVTMDEAVKEADVLMLLRVQHERHDGQEAFSKETYHMLHGLTVAREKQMKHDSIIMHPAPVNRDVEIAGTLVECERSRIFKQSENGVFVRMAALKRALCNEAAE